MSYKTIAVYLARTDSVTGIVNVALPLAEAFDAHIIGLHVYAGAPVTGTIGAQVPPEIVDQYLQFLRKESKSIEKKFTAAMKDAKVQNEWRGSDDISAGVDILHAITNQTRCADLVVMGQSDSEQRVGDLSADIILGTGRPVLIVPAAGKFGEITGRVVIGWDGSREATRAAFDALPILKRAKAVSVATAGKGDDIKAAVRGGGVDLAEALVRHGVHAEVTMLDTGDSSAGEALLAYASEQDCDLLVMGCFSHSRLRERLFGGATRHLLQSMMLPVLMSH